VIEIRGHREGELGWIEEQTQAALSKHASAVVADEGGKIVGMVAFDSWTESAATGHMAVVRPSVWCRLLGPAFDYVFRQQKRWILYGVIPADRHRALRFVEGIGFRIRSKLPDGWARGVDMIVWEMRREGCRFLRG